MRNYLLALKLLLKSRLARSDKKQTAAFASLGILYAILIAFTGIYMYSYVPAFKEAGAINVLLLLMLMGVFSAVIIMGLAAMLGTVFMSRDTEFFSSLPIKASTIFAAKMTVVYLGELVLSALIIIPAMLFIGVFGKMNVGFFISIPLLVLVVPVVPLAMETLLSLPLMYVVRFFKNRGAVTTILLILLFCSLFVVYMFAMNGLQNGVLEGDTDISGILKFKAIKYIIYPLTALSNFACAVRVFGLNAPISNLVNLAFGVGVTAMLAILSVFISGKLYHAGAASQIEGVRKENNKKENYTASRGNIFSLFKRELRDLIRTNTFGFQCLSGIVLVPLIIVMMHFVSSPAGGDEVQAAMDVVRYTNLWMITALGVGMNTCASTGVSREGGTFALTKTLPITAGEWIFAKLILSYVISVITILTSVTTYAFLEKLDIFYVLPLTVFLLIYSYAYCSYALWNDLRSPKLDWTSPSEVVKRSTKAAIPMLVNMGMSLPLLVVMVTFSILKLDYIGFIILIPISIGLTVLWHNMLIKKAVAFSQIEV